MAERLPRSHDGWHEICDACLAEEADPTVCGDCSGLIPVPFSEVVCHPDRLDKPIHWRKPRVVMVPTMGDLFHARVPDEFVRKVFLAMRSAERHTFLVLTKRPDRMRGLLTSWRQSEEWGFYGWAWPNVWPGVTICVKDELDKLDALRLIPAAHRWVSFEPLLEDLGEVNLDGIDQVIVGAESLGARPGRPCDPAWIESIREQCEDAGVPCYVKQSHIGGKLVKRDPEPGELAWR